MLWRETHPLRATPDDTSPEITTKEPDRQTNLAGRDKVRFAGVETSPVAGDDDGAAMEGT
jgi:hypothetical protein